MAANHNHISNNSVNISSAYNSSAYVISAYDTSTYNTSADNNSAYNTSAYNTSGYDTSAYDISAYVTSAYDTSAYDTSAYNTSAYNTSAYVTSAYTTSAYNSSAYNTSAYDTSAYNTSAYDTSAYDTNAYTTSSYNTDTNNSTQSEIDFLRDVFKSFAWIVLVLSLTALIYGVTSWCIIKKFRHIRNYVLLNVMFTNVLRNFLFLFFYVFIIFCPPLPNQMACINIYSYFSFYCFLTFDYWLLVLCYIFYVDFVKVFNSDIRRRYLKSTLFGWGLPFIAMFTVLMAALFFYLYDSRDIFTVHVMMTLELMPVTISLVIYVMVVYSLFRCYDADTSISTKKWRRFYIATLIFILSNIAVLYAVQNVLGIRNYLVAILGASAEVLNSIALVVYFVVGKSNRILWREYLKKRLVQSTLEIR